jgi:hypothetical protein
MPTIEQLRVREVSDKLGAEGEIVGQLSSSSGIALPIKAGRARQTYSITVDASPTAGTDFSVSVLGETATFEATGTRADDVAGLVGAINDTPLIRALFTAAPNSGNTAVILEAVSSHASFDVTVDDEGTNELTLLETSAQADATQLKAGRAVYLDSNKNPTHANPVAGSLSALLGFSRRLLDSEKARLYEDREMVMVERAGRMLAVHGSDAEIGDSIYIEQAAGDDLGRPFPETNATVNRVVLDMDASTTGSSQTYSLQILATLEDGTKFPLLLNVTANYANAGAAVTALEPILDGLMPASVGVVDSTGDDIFIEFADLGATIEVSHSANLDVDIENDGTRLRVPKLGGRNQWAAPHQFDYDLGQ